MEALLARFAPEDFLILVAVVGGVVVMLTLITSITKYQMQALTDDTSLRREKQQAEIALRQKAAERGLFTGGADLDALLAPEPRVVNEQTERENAELARRLGALNTNGEDIEEVLTLAMAAEPARKATIIKVLDDLIGLAAPPAAILAAVRPLCGALKEAPPVAI